MAGEKPQVLLVDDEPLVLSSYGRTLRGLDVELHLADGPYKGIQILEEHSIDVLIADYRMPGMNGDELLALVRERWPDVVRILNTAYADVEIVEKVVRRGSIFRFLTKPCTPEKLRTSVQDALIHHKEMIDNESQSKKLQLDLNSFRQIFQSALDPMMVADLDGRLVEVNEAFLRSMNKNREDALAERPTILRSWNREAQWPEIFKKLQEESHWSDEVRHHQEDRHAILSISVLKDQLGKPYALAAIEKDITMRRQLEKQSWAAQYEVILALAKLAEYRDPETGAHLERLRRYSQALTNQIGKSSAYSALIDINYSEAIFASSPLHDIGKVGIPDAVLLKPGKLTAEEWRVMKLHSSIGAEVLSAAGKTLSQSNWLVLARTIALQHHEKWDGAGYPAGLKGEDIDLSARIVALADAYDAITSKRVYKPAIPHEEARSRILDSSGSHFDPVIVQAFLDCEQDFLRVKKRFTDTGGDDLANTPERRSQTDTWRRIELLVDSSSGRTE